MGWRHGDGAPLSLVELVTFSSPEQKKKSTVKKAKEVLEKVAPKIKGKEKKEKKVKKKEEKEKGKEGTKEKEKKEKKLKSTKKEKEPS
jgi:hypothetical protein